MLTTDNGLAFAGIAANNAIYFSQVHYLYFFFSFLLIYGGLGVGVLGLRSWIGLLGLEFLADLVRDLWCGAFWGDWGLGSLYKQRRITLGKKLCTNIARKRVFPNLYNTSMGKIIHLVRFDLLAQLSEKARINTNMKKKETISQPFKTQEYRQTFINSYPLRKNQHYVHD